MHAGVLPSEGLVVAGQQAGRQQRVPTSCAAACARRCVACLWRPSAARPATQAPSAQLPCLEPILAVELFVDVCAVHRPPGLQKQQLLLSDGLSGGRRQPRHATQRCCCSDRGSQQCTSGAARQLGRGCLPATAGGTAGGGGGGRALLGLPAASHIQGPWTPRGPPAGGLGSPASRPGAHSCGERDGAGRRGSGRPRRPLQQQFAYPGAQSAAAMAVWGAPRVPSWSQLEGGGKS